MSKCISNRGEYSEHTFTHNPECDYCGEPLPKRSETTRTALEQIQEMHKPVDPVFNWKTGLTLRPPCPDCNGKAGVHDCGCWSDKDIEYECSYCNDFGNPRRTQVLWPCETRKLADEGLEGSQ